MRGSAGIARGLANPVTFAAISPVPSSDLLQVARNLRRRRTLLLHDAGDGGGDLVYLIDVAEMPLIAVTAWLDEAWIEATCLEI